MTTVWSLGVTTTVSAERLSITGAVVPGPINSPLRGQTHPGGDRAGLPNPAALAPLYLHLLGAQPKAESGMLIDAGAWLEGHVASTPLVGDRDSTARP